MSMPMSAGKRAPSRASCWRRRRWRPRPGSTSALTPPIAMCASPTREAWTIWKRPLDGLRGFARFEPQDVEARFFREHLGRVLRSRLVEGAGVHLQRGLGVAEPALILAQNLRADLDVDLGLEQSVLAAVVEQLLLVVLRDDLHQALRAHH